MAPLSVLSCHHAAPSACRPGDGALPRLLARARPHRAPGLRAVRRSRRMAGAALRRVHRPSARVRAGRAAIVYDARARRSSRAWKERGRRDLAPLAGDAWSRVVPAPAGRRADVRPGRPGARTRARTRPGAAAGGRARSRWGLPVAACSLRTRRRAAAGGAAARAERRRNVRGASRRSPGAAARSCLVDDVYTTGATASACARRAPAGRRAPRRGRLPRRAVR